MKRILCFALVCILLVLTLSACGKKDENKSNDSYIILYGEKYTFPISISDLTDNGWSFTNSSVKDKMIDANTKSAMIGSEYSLEYHKDGKDGCIYMKTVYNDSSDEQPISSCSLTKITVRGEEIEVPRGITIDSSRDDIIDAFGEPNDDNSDFESCEDAGFQLEYKHEKTTDLSYTFKFDSEQTDKLVNITIEQGKWLSV